ncbi:acyltransferase [Granulicella aggregans]|uniref:acyltransferase n=1 Tax=Granulicella aggregans TaxID=474949 RepID=UPI0037C0D360
MRQNLESKGPIVIGDNCFLGYRVAVTPGVTLGEWCVVGANSVVTKSFPPYSMIAGAPARMIKRYSLEERAWVRVN